MGNKDKIKKYLLMIKIKNNLLLFKITILLLDT
ncbi:hypothetical protein M8044_000505, partial [Columbia Basin potato purple top phytoplasma]|nr:hypothetical protein [Columbia Basin potato purple top phytoplasma]